MNEVWRVLVGDGVLECCVPVAHEPAHGDPTHASVCCPNSFNYFCARGGNFELPLMRRYGFKGRFRRVVSGWRHGGSHYYVEMKAVK